MPVKNWNFAQHFANNEVYSSRQSYFVEALVCMPFSFITFLWSQLKGWSWAKSMKRRSISVGIELTIFLLLKQKMPRKRRFVLTTQYLWETIQPPTGWYKVVRARVRVVRQPPTYAAQFRFPNWDLIPAPEVWRAFHLLSALPSMLGWGHSCWHSSLPTSNL